MANRKRGWGGAREGAGRPPLDPDEQTVRITVTLTESMIPYLLKLGEGSVSQGVRTCVEAHQQDHSPS